jgi:hypothetical protein
MLRANPPQPQMPAISVPKARHRAPSAENELALRVASLRPNSI